MVINRKQILIGVLIGLLATCVFSTLNSFIGYVLIKVAKPVTEFSHPSGVFGTVLDYMLLRAYYVLYALENFRYTLLLDAFYNSSYYLSIYSISIVFFYIAVSSLALFVLIVVLFIFYYSLQQEVKDPNV